MGASAAAGFGTIAGRRLDAQTLAPACIAIPQQTEGPYFVDEKLRRSDLRQDPSTRAMTGGSALQLQLRVASIGASGACTPLAGAIVDIWHCDARGIYSDVEDPGFNTKGQKFLRGYQVTDASGAVGFTTIYPGWYAGRAVHMHFKVRTPQTSGGGSEFTSQLYFDEALTERIHAAQPYASHKGQRLLNERDMIFRENGARLLLPVSESNGRLVGSFNVAMDPNSRSVDGPGGFGGRPGGPGRRGRGPTP